MKSTDDVGNQACDKTIFHELEHSFTLETPLSDVWEFLWNTERVARCIPGCNQVSVIQDNRQYAAQVTKKMGPFAVAICLEIDVIEVRPPHFLTVSIRGLDHRLRSEVTQVISLQLSSAGESTQIDIRGKFSITGLLGHLSKNLIVGQVSQVLDEFSDSLRQAILYR